MGVRFFTRPVPLVVEVKSAKAKFDSVPSRYLTEVVIAEPEPKKGKILHIVVDGVPSDEVSIVTPGTKWRIMADELMFEEESTYGLTFLTMAQMNPERVDEPNQSPQPTRPFEPRGTP
jgi:hypothetical protein